MGLQPIAQNAQVQRLTTALKNICRDYPAGGTVLHELLQNADDAGATAVRFIIDERTHPADQIIDPKLEQYQGPALLAYNNAVFTDADFCNLSRLGDSLKLNDGSTTGRFGRGFNSVYNWTDSPMIVSRERLLILDPHLEWSAGGPVYDFVANSGEAAIRNHMAAFQAVMEHTDQRLEGTIIRIPLRTEAQARQSDISDNAITVSKILEVLQIFASEFGRNGLLFMRSVEKLEIGSVTGSSIRIEVLDAENLRLHKSKVNSAVKSSLNNPEDSFDYSFEAGIEYKSAKEIVHTSFVIHHSIVPVSMDSEIKGWAEGQKLIPWVAVAAQKEDTEIQGSLFTVLPLPIPTHQPVHIHGLFSISPDRGKLYQFDRNNQDQTPAKWNDWLLQGPVPAAWVKLLCYLARSYPRHAAFERWPKSTDGGRGPLGDMTKNMMRIIEKECLAVWPTAVGYVTAKEGLLDTGNESAELREALREAKIPILYVPRRLQKRTAKLFKDRVLCPESLCSFLKQGNSQINLWSDQTKRKTLEYLISKPGFIEYGGLDLFPFRDGVYRPIGEDSVFVHRDEFEESLFCHEDSRNLDLNKLSVVAQNVLRCGCEDFTVHPSIRYRSASSLRDYCMHTIFEDLPPDQDMVELSEEPTAFVSKVWTWILMHRVDIFDNAMSGLWLLPLSNGCYRNIIPRNPSRQVYFAPVGETGELMWTLDARSSARPLPLLRAGPAGSPHGLLPVVTKELATMPRMFITDASSAASFLQWLHQTLPLVSDVADEEKSMIVRVVASRLPEVQTPSEREVAIQALRSLQIFQKITWKADGNKMLPVLTWTSINSSSKSIGLLDGISPIPEISGIQFLIAGWSSPARKILQALDLATCLGSAQVIEDHIIPAWAGGQASNWAYSCKEQAAEFILRQFSCLSTEAQVELRALHMVPVARLNGEETSRLALAADLFDPAVPELRGLCFEDEDILPKESFFRNFSAALRGCGLKSRVDETVVEHRVRCYVESKHQLAEIRGCAQQLLKSACSWTSPLDKLEGSNMRRLTWLPAVDPDGTLSFKSSGECRGRGDRLLVDSQLSILEIPISSEWNKRLGWNDGLPGQTLLSQLNHGIQKTDRQIVDAVLAYISQTGMVDSVADALMNLRCILASSGLFVLPSQAFCPPNRTIGGCERLEPYLVNVERKFWDDHQTILKRLKVGDRPQLSDLLELQSKLESKPELEESDVAVAIEILNLASKFPRESLSGLKVISTTGEFCPLADISFNDLGHLKPKETANMTHADIPSKIVQKLGISSLSEKLIKGMLDIEDEDEEFDQQEKVTTRIADTLERYLVGSTFREYLANADDTDGASRISWLLDERVHPRDNLLTPEMALFQGPALLVYNDGTFSDNDFNGFKNVGEGSKARNKESIGQFGRGSQTMYHWTDVPMILSGEFLLILDPCRDVLPLNQRTGKRMPGIRLQLSKLRHACPGQLAPFEGLWDYTSGLDYYPGTIFRFPLRNTKTASVLRPGKKNLNSGEVLHFLHNYFREARISLLFLRRIKSVSFSVYGNPDDRWSVTRRPPMDEDAKSFSELVVCEFDDGAKVAGKDKWWVAIEDLHPPVNHLPESSRRVMKNVECGIAALISSTAASKPIQSRTFSTLPLDIPSDLPVHVHATFSLSGDRQSIAIDEYGTQSHGSGWNRYLLEDALPKLYLVFLDNIGTQVRHRVFEFWPQEVPPKRSCAELLCASFWEGVPKSSRRLFPKAQLDMGSRQRRPADLLDINQAVFDFLPASQSEILAGLLISLDVNLVRHIPAEITKRLNALRPKVKSVTGPMLRELFKSDRGRKCLLNESTKRPHIMEAIFRQIIPTEADLADLDGCHLLPLADGSLATFKYLDDRSPKYYLASERELTLFTFASKCLVAPGTGDRLRPLLESGKFNFVPLRLCHMERLLAMKPPVSAPNPEAERWLANFWEFWNASLDSTTSNTINSQAKIFRATRDGLVSYASPAEFQEFPAVVQPSSLEHQQLCDNIPGLYHFDPKLMPKSLMNSEKSFNNEESFYRFVQALSALAGASRIGLFVKTHLGLTDLEIFRGLIITHLSDQGPSGRSDRITDLKSIPVWPSLHTSSTDQLIPASNALIALDDRLLTPWMKDRHRFIDPQFARDRRNRNCLLALGVTKQSAEVLINDYVLPLPATLSDTYWQHFLPFIAAIADTNIPAAALKQCKIAADGTRALRKACELYDHDDPIFVSAFRLQREAQFVHDSTKKHRNFWLRAGLRHREDSLINPVDYLQCLQAMKLRLRAENRHIDPHLGQDSREVLSPLTAPSSSIQRFGAHDWTAIAHESVFLSRTTFNTEPEYRQHTMATVASKQPLLCISEIISCDHTGICWSQTPFPIHQPTKEVLSKTPSRGQPEIDMVWRHLEQIKDVARHLKRHQIRDFLADLSLTYQYLQDNLPGHVSGRPKNSAVWLNLNTLEHNAVLLDDIKSSWHTTEELVLSSALDVGSMKAVRPGLMRYEKLLRAAGCSSIIYPTIIRPEIQLGVSISSALRQFRRDRMLTDIEYSTEGKTIHAHRVVLAASSNKCAIQFSGRWNMVDVIHYDKSVDPESFLSYHTLSTIIDYAYEDEINWKAMEVMEDDDAAAKTVKLELLLDLHKGADSWIMPTLASRIEDKILLAGRAFINIGNVIRIRERAVQVRAMAVAQMCAEFIESNQPTVRKAHSECSKIRAEEEIAARSITPRLL